jgi:S-adenosylmethionine/arginine decarboxylase-like enzyme
MEMPTAMDSQNLSSIMLLACANSDEEITAYRYVEYQRGAETVVSLVVSSHKKGFMDATHSSPIRSF